MSERSEMHTLVLSTTRIYREALSTAFNGTKKNWWGAFLPIVYVAIMVPAIFLLSPFGMAGGFVLGFFIACLVANYFTLISASVLQERISPKELLQRSGELISPVISALFALWILQLIGDMAFRGPNHVWLLVSLNFVVVVLFNALPEVIYQLGGNASYLFGTAFSFMKENFIEWFVALFLIFLPLIVWDPHGFFLSFASSGPLEFPRLVLTRMLLEMQEYPLSIGISLFLLTLFATLFIGVFRGVLFKELFHSTRRKRIYNERFR